jgi:hypothetical protein
MSAPIVATIIIVAVVVIALVLIVGTQQARRRRLRERFGPEYKRRVEERGDRRQAERELGDLARERDRLDITPLDPQARSRYLAAWNQVQSQFVDQPQEALESADVLVGQVMRERGYPVEDFDSRADLVAVDHPGVVNHYRGAHAVQVRGDGDVTTEDQRLAFVHYRELFGELIDDTPDGRTNGHRVHADRGERR